MLMMKIAFRNIFRQKRRTILTALTMVGGFVLLSLSLAISDGTYGSLIDTFTRMHTGHLQIHKAGYLEKPSLYATINTFDELDKQLGLIPELKSWAPRVYSSALVFAGKKTTAGKIIGIDPRREEATTTIRQKLEHGDFVPEIDENSVVIGAGIAEILNVSLNDELVFIAQAADGSIANDIFRITGFIGESNDSLERMNCYMNIVTAQRFLELPDRIHEVAVVIDNYKNAQKMTKKLGLLLNDKHYEVHSWQKIEEQFYKSMQADVEGMWITIVIIMLIVGIGVLNTVLMTILERTAEFGVLKALGTRPLSILKLIILETTFLAVISVCLGIILSLLLNYYFSLHGIEYPDPVDVGGITVERMQATINARSIVFPAVITFFTAIIVCIFPGIRAARVVPVDAIRSM